MKAELQPLDGKYYGTDVDIALDDGSFGRVNIWVHDNRRIPSWRELERSQCETVDEAIANDVTCDNHFESDVSLDIAVKLVNAINGK